MNFSQFTSFFQGEQDLPPPSMPHAYELHHSQVNPHFRSYSITSDAQSTNMSDWGIEETLSTRSNIPKIGPSPARDFNYHYAQSEVDIPATTENFSKYIQAYLRLRLNKEFWDKFKYNLLISNLLDGSMVLSKNEQALHSLDNNKHNFSMKTSVFYKILNDDGTSLIVTKDYTLKFPKNYYFRNHVIHLTYLVVYLLKQKISHKLDHATQIRMFKVLLIISTKVIKFKRAYMTIQMSKVLNLCNDFLKNNFKINKKIILNLGNLKNLKLFDNVHLSQFFSQLNETLNFLIFNVKSSIIKLLPLLNGPVFEQYCSINNINIEFEDCETNNEDPNNDINQIIHKINQFNEYRKFLICQLLTIDGKSEKNFFLLKIIDHFGLSDREFEINELTNLTHFEKLLILEEMFVDYNKILDSFHLLFDKFEKINNVNLSLNLNENEDILKLTTRSQSQISDNNLNQLINKLSTLTTNLKFFQKYNQSTLDNRNELSEKVTILSQFNTDIAAINELYRLSLLEFTYQVHATENEELISNSSNSNRNSRNSGEFSLKSFHTRNRKKLSLVSNRSPQLPLKSPTFEDDDNRLSGGLKLGLLTVFENEGNHQNLKQRKPSRKTDDNLAGYDYNQITLDSLSKRKASRFSINSLNSNISGLSDIVASTQTTSFDEDENLLSKDELKLRLEESLNKIYNLENQVQHSHIDDEINEIQNNDTILVNETAIDKSFLENLEKTLNKK